LGRSGRALDLRRAADRDRTELRQRHAAANELYGGSPVQHVATEDDCMNIGLDRVDLRGLTPAEEKFVQAMNAHVASLETPWWRRRTRNRNQRQNDAASGPGPDVTAPVTDESTPPPVPDPRGS
jgi:hypothetical protein